MREIIEDTISRDKQFQEERRLRVNRLKELNAPDSIIETEEMIAKMTAVEYKIYCKELLEEEKKIKSVYAENNPIQQSIVDEIYTRESQLDYNYSIYSSNISFMMAIDPLKFMSQDDFHNDLYMAFLEHAQEIYKHRFKDKFKDQIELDSMDGS